MQIRLGHIFLIMLFASAFIYSCGTSKDIGSRCKKMSDKELTEILFAKDTVPFDFFFTNIGVDIKSEKVNNWFASTIKMRVDSAFGGTVKVGPVVAATFVIDKDSMIVANKMDKCFIRENFQYISSVLGTEIQYDFLEELILGLPVGLDREREYKQLRAKEYYVLGTKKKKKFRRIGHPDQEQDEEILIQYHMRCKDFDLEKITIQIPSDTVEMTILYKDKKVEDGFVLPNITHLIISHPTDSIRVAINSGRVRINQPKEIKVNISDDYKECP